MKKISIDQQSSEPVYEQIVRQVRSAVQRGTLRTGEVLMPVRQLADMIGVNPNTVAKAYKILERDRIIRGAGRRGTFVEDNAAIQIENGNRQEAHYEFDVLIRSMRARGLTTAQIKVIMFDQIEKIGEQDGSRDDRQISFKGEGFTKKIPSFFSRKQK